MKYFIFKKRGEKIEKGDKVKILVRKFNQENSNFEETILEEFIIENFEYYPECELYILNSPVNFSEEELEEKVGSGEIIALIEKNVSQNEK